jgi:hypothetical protein
LQDGRVLVVGGRGKRNNAEIFDPADNTWTRTPDLSEPRGQHTAVLTADGKVIVAGGMGNRSSSEIYDPKTDTWAVLANMEEPRFRHASVMLNDGTILVLGGNGKEMILAEVEKFSR